MGFFLFFKKKKIDWVLFSSLRDEKSGTSGFYDRVLRTGKLWLWTHMACRNMPHTDGQRMSGPTVVSKGKLPSRRARVLRQGRFAAPTDRCRRRPSNLMTIQSGGGADGSRQGVSLSWLHVSAWLPARSSVELWGMA
jgi:hypothetical protein